MTPILGKVFEHVIRSRIAPKLKAVQADLQLGFTAGLTPGLASIIVMEASIEADDLGIPLLMCTLDVKKAF